MAAQRTWKVTVEDTYGIIAQHCVEAHFAETARELEEAKGYNVLHVAPCKDEHCFHISV